MSTALAPVTPLPAVPTWTQVDGTLWVASTRDEFLGTVEQAGIIFIARDRFATEIGRYGDFGTAKSRVLHPSSRARARRRKGLDDVALAWTTAVIGSASILGSLSILALGLAA
jgi:hypothetical protein